MPRRKYEMLISRRRSADQFQVRRRPSHQQRNRTSKPQMKSRMRWEELEEKAYRAGNAAAVSQTENPHSYEHMQTSYKEWYGEKFNETLPWRSVLAISNAYRRGYNKFAKQTVQGIPLPLYGKASAVVSACNEGSTIAAVIAELLRLPIQEIIVVLNGCKDGSFRSIESNERVTVVSYPERLGHDVARAIGASLASGDTVLFADGDIVLAAEDLAPFLVEVENGIDVVLNDISPYLPPFSKQDAVTHSKMFLNYMLGRPDLKANSLTAVPHALSRRALASLGATALIVPPKALALAIAQGLKIRAPRPVDVVRNNRLRSGNVGDGNEVSRLILGDHIEAFEAVMRLQGRRLNMTRLPRSELARKRNGR
ncbi:glycosyltransferase family 2 protein [Paenibacillus woosongensis]|nr:glycosyltransferase family A protein [Paenibacillus woosongensis]